MSELSNEVQKTANQLVELVASGRLDFSIDSLAVVEELLNEAAPFIADPNGPEAENLVTGFGCYILEVGQRAFGGYYQWFEERKQPVLIVGEPAFHLAIITWDKVRARLSGDPSDNIPFFFAGFAERVKAAQPGERALYV